MRTTLLLLALTFVGLYAHPPAVLAAMTARTQTPAIKKMVNDWVELRNLIRRIKMDLSDLQAKIGATILTDGDRAGMKSLYEEDMERLRSDRSAFREATQELLDHWSDLTPDQQAAVQEVRNFPE